MDKQVLKWTTAFVAMICIAFCSLSFFLPQIHEQSVLAAQENFELLYTKESPKYEGQNPQDIVFDEENVGAQLKIELPSGIELEDLRISNDYLTQTIYINIPVDSEDYFADYSVRGSCDHIAGISYYREGTKGVISFTMDRVFELSQEYEEGYLYLDFVDPHEIFDKVIVVDAGHGGRAVGATKLGISEKDINLAIVLELKKLLDEDENIGVYYTRINDTNPTLDQRVALANRVEADLFISVHNNASSRGILTNEQGTQVLYSQSDTAQLSSKRLAQICLENVVDTTGSNNMGLLKGDQIRIVRNSEVPVALIEVGFMSNREELELLNTQEYQQLVAEGIYLAIQQAFEEGY
ncbi:MAG: N-acetylmuramoyl-L-alanine amidase [Lachnospiraceae bacterium]|nr:N-acetylmuramoyl-L-alanine amidase [Lachnospiraceae bacterium]